MWLCYLIDLFSSVQVTFETMTSYVIYMMTIRQHSRNLCKTLYQKLLGFISKPGAPHRYSGLSVSVS